jgi:hypothetical protein
MRILNQAKSTTSSTTRPTSAKIHSPNRAARGRRVSARSTWLVYCCRSCASVPGSSRDVSKR